MRLSWILSCILVISWVAGCSGGPKATPVAKATGTVKFKGQPVEGATVNFIPKNERLATGTTDAQGVFVLTTHSGSDGAVVGEHIVTLSKIGPPAGMTQEQYIQKQKSAGVADIVPDPTYLVPKKYFNQFETPLKATVKAGEANKFEFDLTE